MKKLRASLTYANVVSTLCLFVLLGGTSYAAVHYLVGANSVKTQQIVDGSIKGQDLGRNVIDGGKVKNEALSGADVKENTLVVPTGGDLTGNLSNAAIAANAITGAEIADGAITPADTGERWAFVDGDGKILNQSGGITVVGNVLGPGNYYVDFMQDISGKMVQVTPVRRDGDVGLGVSATAAVCGGPPLGATCDYPQFNTSKIVYVATAEDTGTADAQAFYISVK